MMVKGLLTRGEVIIIIFIFFSTYFIFVIPSKILLSPLTMKTKRNWIYTMCMKFNILILLPNFKQIKIYSLLMVWILLQYEN